MIQPRIKVVKTYPGSKEKGTILYPGDYHYNLLNQKKFKEFFKTLPYDYTIKEKDKDGTILSVQRHYDRTIFRIGDKYKNSLSAKTYILTGFMLDEWTVTLMYKEGQNCGINNATKIKK